MLRVLKNLAAQSHLSIRTLVMIYLNSEGAKARLRPIIY
jgi:hypothetical protein